MKSREIYINEVKKTGKVTEAGEIPIYYFAYGMLCDPEVMTGVDFEGVAELRNHKLELLRFANVVPDAGSKVYGCLWKLDRRLLSQLDRIEGYPSLYDRKTVPVYVNGQKIVAEIYTMTTQTREDMQDTVPTRDYLRKVLRGYRKAGIPKSQLTVNNPKI